MLIGRPHWVALPAGIAAIGLGIALVWQLLKPTTPKIDPEDTAQVALGHAVYTAQCARCHGNNLEGQPNWRERQANGRLPAPPHDASGHTWHHPDLTLFDITKNGVGPYAPAGYKTDMPAFRRVLTDEQIAAVLAYIKSTWPADVRRRQARVNAQSSARDNQLGSAASSD